MIMNAALRSFFRRFSSFVSFRFFKTDHHTSNGLNGKTLTNHMIADFSGDQNRAMSEHVEQMNGIRNGLSTSPKSVQRPTARIGGVATQRVSSSNSQGRRSSGGLGYWNYRPRWAWARKGDILLSKECSHFFSAKLLAELTFGRDNAI